MRLDKYKLIFWDFDGVIKESNAAKTESFLELFKHYNNVLLDKIHHHHINNGGMSRFNKIPLYMEWGDEPVSQYTVGNYCKKFSALVFQKVIESDWVPGVVQYLSENQHSQQHILVSATPEDELREIVSALDINKYFKSIYGAPSEKKAIICAYIKKKEFSLDEYLMIGDANSDKLAAQENNIAFLLRIHKENEFIFKNYSDPLIESFEKLL